MRLRWWMILLAVLALVPMPAAAQSASSCYQRGRDLLEDYLTALEHDPELVNVYLHLGGVYERLNLPAEALTAYCEYLSRAAAEAAAPEAAERAAALGPCPLNAPAP